MFEYLQHVVESTPQRIKAVLKLKGVQFSAGKVYVMKWLVSIYAFIAAQAYNHSAAAKQTCPAPVSITPLNILSLSHTLFCTHTHTQPQSVWNTQVRHTCLHTLKHAVTLKAANTLQRDCVCIVLLKRIIFTYFYWYVDPCAWVCVCKAG